MSPSRIGVACHLALIRQVLARHTGVRLLTAGQGGVGLEMARQHRPDAVLLDLHIPDVPGSEVLEKLKAHDETRDIPVIVVTADATLTQIRRALALGASDYLTKPFDIEALHVAIGKALDASAVARGGG